MLLFLTLTRHQHGCRDVTYKPAILQSLIIIQKQLNYDLSLMLTKFKNQMSHLFALTIVIVSSSSSFVYEFLESACKKR